MSFKNPFRTAQSVDVRRLETDILLSNVLDANPLEFHRLAVATKQAHQVVVAKGRIAGVNICRCENVWRGIRADAAAFVRRHQAVLEGVLNCARPAVP